MASTKLCRKCGKKRSLDEFQKNPSATDGRRGTCKVCMGSVEPPMKRFFRPLSGERFIITSAQNDTPIHEPFFRCLQVAAEHLGAELVVIPLRYKNPTSQAENARAQREARWEPALVPYLFNARKKLCPNLVLVGDVKTQPTASTPLTGFESLTGAESCIIGHPKMQLRTVPVPTGRFPKVLTTTGAVTERNYSDTKAGKIGAFHHFLGALIVEVQGKRFHIRQVNADRADGSFTDLDKCFTVDGVVAAPPALGLVMGDTHVRVTDPAVDEATFGAGGIVETVNPKALVFHDIFDGETVNPHEVGDLFLAAAKQKAGRQDVRAELEQVVEFLKARAGGRNVVIVDSNHHDFLRRWVVRNLNQGCHDAKNLGVFLESAQVMFASAKMGPGGAEYADPFRYWMGKLGAPVRCLEADESFKLADNECGMHGNRGPNGSLGTLKNLSRLGAKVISGHTHTPGIEEGHYQVGTSTPRRLAYQKGPGANLNTHCVVYASGKRALITIVDGEWRLPDLTADTHARSQEDAA